MAEYCLECMNKYIMEEHEQLTERDVKLGFDLCEGCEKFKPCVIAIKKKTLIRRIINYWTNNIIVTENQTEIW